MTELKTDPDRLPGHEQVAAFWVGATLATQAIAVYIDAGRSQGPYGTSPDFDALPARLKIRTLEACEQEFERWREKLLQECLEAGDPTVTDHISKGSFSD